VTVTRTQSVGVALGQATQNTEAGLPKLKGLKMPSVQTYSIVQSDNRSPNGSIQTRGTTEEEWVTKKTVEITTTKNIERKVHRQLVLEDGRVLDEEVPTVTIDRTEDKQIFETDHDEERDFDNHDNDMAVHSTFTTNNGDKFTTVKTTKDVKENMTRTEAVQNIGNIRSRELSNILNDKKNIKKYIKKSNEEQNQVRQGYTSLLKLNFLLQLQVASSQPRTVFSSRKHHVVTDKEDVKEREWVSGGKVKKEKIKTEEHIEYDSDDSLCSSSSASSAKSSHYELVPEDYKTRTEESFTEYFVKGKGANKSNMVKVSDGPHYKSESKEGHKEHDYRWIQKNNNKGLKQSTHKQLTQVRSLDNETKKASTFQSDSNLKQNFGTDRMSNSSVDLRRMGSFDEEQKRESRFNNNHSQENEEKVYVAKVIQSDETPTVKMRKKRTDLNYYTANRQSANFSSSGQPIRPPRAKEYTFSNCRIQETKKELLKQERPQSLNLTENYYFGDSAKKTGKYSYPLQLSRQLGRSYHSTQDLSSRHSTHHHKAQHSSGQHEDKRIQPTPSKYNYHLLPALRQERNYHSAQDLSKESSSFSAIERPHSVDMSSETTPSVQSNYKLIPSMRKVKNSHIHDESNKHYNSTGNIYKSVTQERHRQVNSLKKNEPQYLSVGDISFASGHNSSFDRSSNSERDITIERKMVRKSSGKLIFSSERPKNTAEHRFLFDNEANSTNIYSLAPKQSSRTVPIDIQSSRHQSRAGSPSTRYRTRVVVTGQA